MLHSFHANKIFSRRSLLRMSAALSTIFVLPDSLSSSVNTSQTLPMYSMALIPPPDLSDIYNNIRQKFDSERVNKTFPHITLKQPFIFADADPIHEQKLLEAMKLLCHQQKPFDVQIDNIDMFDSPAHGSVVHLQIHNTPLLSALQSAIVRAVNNIGGITEKLLPEQEEKIYYPHLTLAQGLSRAAAEAAIASIDTHTMGHSAFRVQQLVVGRCGSDQVWQKIAELDFTK